MHRIKTKLKTVTALLGRTEMQLEVVSFLDIRYRRQVRRYQPRWVAATQMLREVHAHVVMSTSTELMVNVYVWSSASK